MTGSAVSHTPEASFGLWDFMFGPLPPPSLPHLVLLQVRPIARVIRLAHPAANEDMEMMFEAEESLSPEEVTAVKENA